MKRLWLELKPGKDLLFIDCVYISACTTEKTRSLGKANVLFLQSAESAGLRGRTMEQSMTLSQPPLVSCPDHFRGEEKTV